MINSMTAFSANEVTKDALSVAMEIRSYNSKNLDIALKMPYSYAALEDRLKKRVAEKITRGRMEIRVTIKNDAEAFSEFEINLPKARAYYAALNKLQKSLGLDGPIPLDVVLKAGEIITSADVSEDLVETVWPVMDACLAKVIDGLHRMRREEGDFIARDFEVRLAYIESCLGGIEDLSKELPGVYQQRLKDRIVALTEGVIEIDPSRISQEVAILADKSDISEEVTRARSHMQQFRRLMASDEQAGRKLNFLLQELNREFNTMGSKSGDAQLSHLIVTVKSELEKIREQVQNVE